MRFVFDASVAVKLVLPEMALEADFRDRIHQLIAPDTY
jgi:hypothetical protein